MREPLRRADDFIREITVELLRTAVGAGEGVDELRDCETQGGDCVLQVFEVCEGEDVVFFFPLLGELVDWCCG